MGRGCRVMLGEVVGSQSTAAPSSFSPFMKVQLYLQKNIYVKVRKKIILNRYDANFFPCATKFPSDTLMLRKLGEDIHMLTE